jgi:hypothetical protein
LGTSSVRPKEVHVGSRGRRRESQGRAESRVRGRVRERVRGREGRGEGRAGRKRGTFDADAIEGYADRLADRVGGTSGLVGAASGLAGGGFAHRILDSNTESSEEDFRNEVREHLDLMDERLRQLEDEMHALREGGGDVQEPGSGSDPDSDQ